MDEFGQLCYEISNCKNCDLSYSRRRAVCGFGDQSANIMIIGEAPGTKEDIEGLPFVGRSGALLDRVLAQCGISRKDLYITNSVRCKPPFGKAPRSEHIKACSSYLAREISLLKPSVIVPMGNTAISALCAVLKFRTGKVTEMNGKILRLGEYLIIPQFHPAAILRSPKREEVFRENFHRIASIGREIKDKGIERVLSSRSLELVNL
ncbi:MAG: uracil-DNA glycosylase [Candidatus Thermoplasmatota archaeon]|jgi:DNA polymerase|nr:uracil-DNA glycosylase [Candidatus Thermoplasmatota archaeon]